MSTFSLELIRKKLTYFPKPSGIKFPKHPSLVKCTLSDIMNWVYDETAALIDKWIVKRFRNARTCCSESM